jgi:flagellar protein FliO/FliZ
MKTALTSVLKKALGLALLCLSSRVLAQGASSPSTALNMLPMLLGLLIVLAIIVALAWLVKKISHINGGGHSVARIVGGVSVGTRERVVVLEIANRWIVVGVASGQVSAIANLDRDASHVSAQDTDKKASGADFLTALMPKLNLNQASNRNEHA